MEGEKREGRKDRFDEKIAPPPVRPSARLAAAVLMPIGASMAAAGKENTVLVADVWIPSFVSFLSTVLILSYFCPTCVSYVSHFCPLSHFCLVCVFKFSVLS